MLQQSFVSSARRDVRLTRVERISLNGLSCNIVICQIGSRRFIPDVGRVHLCGMVKSSIYQAQGLVRAVDGKEMSESPM